MLASQILIAGCNWQSNEFPSGKEFAIRHIASGEYVDVDMGNGGRRILVLFMLFLESASFVRASLR